MKIVDLDNGLELWKIEIKDLREQDLNARYMKSEMFNIRSTNTLMMYLMETIYDKLGLEMDSPVEVDEFENIGTLMGFGMIPKEYEKAIKERFKKYDYKSHERYKAFLDILGIEHD